MRRTVVFALLLMLAVVPLFAGGQGESGAEEDIVIAVVPKGLDNPVFLDTKQGAEDAGKELGVTVNWTGPVKADAAEQVQVLEGLIQQGVDGMLVSSNDPTALNDVIARAVEEGIVVATFDSDAPDSDRLFYAGSDNYALGERSAELMIELAADRDGTVETALLTGVLGAHNLEERIRGFEETVEGTNVEVVSVQAGQDDINKSVEVVEDYTRANPDLDAWCFVGGWPFFAPEDAFSELPAFREDGDGLLVSVDSFWPMLDFLENGFADYLVGQDFYKMGVVGVENLVAAINGDPPDEEIIDTGMEIVNPDNVAEVREQKTPWE
ncbi:MAG: sugar-binding protein [Spirochaetaceae bacterium]